MSDLNNDREGTGDEVQPDLDTDIDLDAELVEATADDDADGDAPGGGYEEDVPAPPGPVNWYLLALMNWKRSGTSSTGGSSDCVAPTGCRRA